MSKNAGKMLEAMDNFFDAIIDAAKEFLSEEAAVNKERTVDLDELSQMVSDETGMKEGCVYDVLECAFELIKELDLTVVVEGDDDEE